MDQLYREFGRLLRQCRKKANLTQEDLADRVGLARTSITNIEQGRQHVSLHVLYELAETVGVSAHELLPDKVILLKDNPQLEKNLGKAMLEEEQKDWIRRLVSKTNPAQEGK
jgi:transcriptional regulator with XRE-family HTH domain